MNDISEYVSITYFAQAHKVPLQAVKNAIAVGRLKPSGVYVNGEISFHASLLVDYKFDLIGIYEYAERKGVSYMAVYKRTANKKNPILFSVDEVTDIMKIDWELYHDAHFKAVKLRFRSKAKVA